MLRFTFALTTLVGLACGCVPDTAVVPRGGGTQLAPDTGVPFHGGSAEPPDTDFGDRLAADVAPGGPGGPTPPDQDIDGLSLLPSAEVPDVRPPLGCRGLFGRPGENTGLSPSQCQPVCACGGESFSPPDYTAEDIAQMAAWVLVDPHQDFVSLPHNPYDHSGQYRYQPTQVCAMLPDAPGTYRLETHASQAQAQAAGGRVTHTGACGLCSSLQDLAVYVGHSDLSTPVKSCGIRHAASAKEAHVACLEEIGFSRPCAVIWYYNTKHTGKKCPLKCAGQFLSGVFGRSQKYHKVDGSLSRCIQCDEDESGEVFKAVAGRTRRNSGLPSALCRPCAGVSRIVHDYMSP